MSRRCRDSLSQMAARGAGSFSSGCDCARLSGISDAPPPCTEPLDYGDNILIDPGFEGHLNLTGGGPQGDEIPSQKWNTGEPDKRFPAFTDGSQAVNTGWSAQTNYVAGDGHADRRAWYIDDTDARSGTFHARQDSTEAAVLGGGGNLIPYRFNSCIGDKAFSARVNPGDLIVWSVWSKTTTTSFGTRVEFHNLQWWKSPSVSAGQLVGAPGQPSLGTDYQQFTVAAIVPPEVFYVNAIHLIGSTSDGSYSAFVDDAVLGLRSGGGEIIICASFTLIEVDNSTTETSFV